MYKRGLCRRAGSVRLSVTFVYYIETKNVSSNSFSPSGSHTILVFFHTNVITIFVGDPNWDKNRDFRPISGFGNDHCWTVACRQHFDGVA